MKNVNRLQNGFTLIELMIVVAIIGILAAVAIPQYQDYVTRSKYQSGVAALESTKALSAECVQNSAGNPMLCDTDVKLQTVTGQSSFVMPSSADNGITLSRGTFTSGTGGAGGAMVFLITGPASMGSCVVTLTGTVQSGNVIWTYTNGGAAGCNKAKTGF